MKRPSVARGMWDRFWRWYERHYALNVAAASGLFVLQLVHLYWLAADPIAMRLVGASYFNPAGAIQYAIFFVDYTEIPALMAVSLVYVNELRGGFAWRPVLFLAFLNSQWLHIFWITDQYVSNELSGRPTVSSLPGWLAWVAILIDYLELPVIYDTFRRAAATMLPIATSKIPSAVSVATSASGARVSATRSAPPPSTTTTPAAIRQSSPTTKSHHKRAKAAAKRTSTPPPAPADGPRAA
jgi:hypothetical protein